MKAKVTIVITDLDNDEVNLNVHFDPPIPKEGEMTTAQSLGVTALEAIASSGDIEEIDPKAERGKE